MAVVKPSSFVAKVMTRPPFGRQSKARSTPLPDISSMASCVVEDIDVVDHEGVLSCVDFAAVSSQFSPHARWTVR